MRGVTTTDKGTRLNSQNYISQEVAWQSMNEPISTHLLPYTGFNLLCDGRAAQGNSWADQCRRAARPSAAAQRRIRVVLPFRELVVPPFRQVQHLRNQKKKTEKENIWTKGLWSASKTEPAVPAEQTRSTTTSFCHWARTPSTQANGTKQFYYRATAREAPPYQPDLRMYDSGPPPEARDAKVARRWLTSWNFSGIARKVGSDKATLLTQVKDITME
ncbi:unnamed protein product [Gadus morhua 'NCC']